MNTREVAEYLRIKERKVYDLVAQRRIPCTRAAGKWLFPKDLVDMWLLHSAEGIPSEMPQQEPPAIVTGSHDPLLEWAVRASGSELAVLFDGSLDGLDRFGKVQAVACGLHVLDEASGDYNTPLLEQRLSTRPVVAIEWARRQQGLVVQAGNPLGIATISDLAGCRIALRQKEAGSYLLLAKLLADAGMTPADLGSQTPPLRSETEVALAIAGDQADAGLAIEAVANQLRVGFVPLIEERYDLLLWRRQYFDPPVQRLLTFCHGGAFAQRASELSGYNISQFGKVRFNARC